MFSPDLPKSAEQNCSCGCLKKYPIASLSVEFATVIALKTRATRRIVEFIPLLCSFSPLPLVVMVTLQEIISYICLGGPAVCMTLILINCVRD